MADMNQLTQLIADVSSDDFYFLVEASGRAKTIWLSLFVKEKMGEHVFFDLNETEEAMAWIEEQRTKHGRA